MAFTDKLTAVNSGVGSIMDDILGIAKAYDSLTNPVPAAPAPSPAATPPIATPTPAATAASVLPTWGLYAFALVAAWFLFGGKR